ncbi:hypothetical protein RGI145_15360 [Roseomonas gilardii]|uniref:Uncharacterized protein n=1 Tax=Roseomonas gilardii TaxID=257708 RepID=A0A1L7AHL7_9PROT|nr:hypothetical protein [Roseomonas gilardii]APT58286.1 hypothetical protein RGI145_15360 [Roseomonas gilardii]
MRDDGVEGLQRLSLRPVPGIEAGMDDAEVAQAGRRRRGPGLIHMAGIGIDGDELRPGMGRGGDEAVEPRAAAELAPAEGPRDVRHGMAEAPGDGVDPGRRHFPVELRRIGHVVDVVVGLAHGWASVPGRGGGRRVLRPLPAILSRSVPSWM